MHRATEPLELILYGKPDCSLCDQALAAVAATGFLRRHRVRCVDICRDPELFDLYKWDIPVLVLGGREILKGIVTEARLRARFAELEVVA